MVDILSNTGADFQTPYLASDIIIPNEIPAVLDDLDCEYYTVINSNYTYCDLMLSLVLCSTSTPISGRC